MTCEMAHLDGAYVLGSLSPSERQQFERHLRGCADCARSVQELAGLPGLLTRVDPDMRTSRPETEPVPETLLPALAAEIRRAQRRRAFVTAGFAAAAVVVLIVSVAVMGFFDSDPEPGSPGTALAPPRGEAMTAVGETPMSASVAFAPMPWGTRLDVTCSYEIDAAEYGTPREATYALVVRTAAGGTEQIATWRSIPGRTMSLTAATAAGLGDITSVQVRTARGEPVLKLTE
jgi:hypothetical protein